MSFCGPNMAKVIRCNPRSLIIKVGTYIPQLNDDSDFDQSFVSIFVCVQYRKVNHPNNGDLILKRFMNESCKTCNHKLCGLNETRRLDSFDFAYSQVMFLLRLPYWLIPCPLSLFMSFSLAAFHVFFCRYVSSDLATDVTIIVGEVKFYLHKVCLPHTCIFLM